MNKIKFLAILSLLVLSRLASAQDNPVASTEENKDGKIAQNAICGEAFGNSLAFSINYERVFLNKRPFFLTGRIGMGYYRSKSSMMPVFHCSKIADPCSSGSGNSFHALIIPLK